MANTNGSTDNSTIKRPVTPPPSGNVAPGGNPPEDDPHMTKDPKPGTTTSTPGR